MGAKTISNDLFSPKVINKLHALIFKANGVQAINSINRNLMCDHY